MSLAPAFNPEREELIDQLLLKAGVDDRPRFHYPTEKWVRRQRHEYLRSLVNAAIDAGIALAK